MRPALPRDAVSSRRLILAVAAPILVLELLMSWRTFGTNDIAHWTDFLRGEQAAGPVGIYGYRFPPADFYNHPPLIGYYLQLGNWLRELGIPFRFTIRASSSLADIGTALVVFELVRRRRTLRSATLAGLLVVASPGLFIVAGYHGNTDPIFEFLTLLAVWLLADRNRPGWAGVAIGLAVGVKIVPIVVVPCLMVYAWKRSRETLVRLVLAAGAVFVVTWGPALLSQFANVKSHVVGYKGVGITTWGVIQVGHQLGDPWWVGFLTGSGRFLIVLVCALVPAALVWRRPDQVAAGAAWALMGFLALAVADGTHYTTWPLAAAYVLDVGWATAYNLLDGLILFEIYNRWSGGLPWYRARADGWNTREQAYMEVLWVLLLVLWARTTVVILRAPRTRGKPQAEPAAIASGPTRGDRTARHRASVEPG